MNPEARPRGETWARIAAEGVWSLIWVDKGAPKGPDPELVAAATQKVTTLDSERRRAEQTLHALEAQKKVVRQQAIDTAGGGDVAATLQAMLKLDALGDEVVAATGVLSEADKTLEWAKHALGEAKATGVPLPDEDPVAAETVDDVEIPDVGRRGSRARALLAPESHAARVPLGA